MSQHRESDTRRSLRVVTQIPVSLRAGQNRPEQGVTAVVNRHGALLLSPVEYEEGAILSIRNELTAEAAGCRVTWIGSTETGTVHKLGIEFIDASPTFWGTTYEDAVTMAAEQADNVPSNTPKSKPSS